MSDVLLNFVVFAAKTLFLLLLLVLAAGAIGSAIQGARRQAGDHLEVVPLNERLDDLRDAVEIEALTEPERKATQKARRKQKKAEGKVAAPKPRLFVLDFVGDLEASATVALRDEITAILQVARADDAVLLRLESEGGLVHGYGLAASQLQRLRSRGIRLTAAVDKVAASGGYLMAAVADEIVAAPFAIVGSIGVVAQIPNVHRLLKKHDVDVELHTAGAYKRTLTVFGRNTDAARTKFQADLEDTHALFKEFVAEHRPVLDLEAVATGEHWFGTRALALKLVDQLITSDDWLLAKAQSHQLLQLRYRRRRPLSERLHFSLLRLLARGRAPLAGLDPRPAAPSHFML